MSCVIKEVDDNVFDPELLERQLGLALIKQAEGDPQKLLVTVLSFLKRKSNFFKHGDPKKRLLDAYSIVSGEGAAAGATGAASGARPAPPAAAAAAASGASAAAVVPPPAAAAAADQPKATAAAAPPAAPAAAAASTSGPPSPDVAPRAEAAEDDGKPDQSKGLSEPPVVHRAAPHTALLRTSVALN
jgi:hypothetical protein